MSGAVGGRPFFAAGGFPLCPLDTRARSIDPPHPYPHPYYSPILDGLSGTRRTIPGTGQHVTDVVGLHGRPAAAS